MEDNSCDNILIIENQMNEKEFEVDQFNDFLNELNNSFSFSFGENQNADLDRAMY